MTSQVQDIQKHKTRVGVYGVIIADDKILLIRQGQGPFTDKFDFPGGGIEWGETPEQALRREFIEEIAVEFDSFKLVENLTAATPIPAIDPYIFYQIGMIYEVSSYRTIKDCHCEFQPIWADLKTLTENQCSSLLWKYVVSISHD